MDAGLLGLPHGNGIYSALKKLCISRNIDDTEERTSGRYAMSSTRLSGPEWQYSEGLHSCATPGSDFPKDSTGGSKEIYQFARCLLPDKYVPKRYLKNGIQDTLWNV